MGKKVKLLTFKRANLELCCNCSINSTGFNVKYNSSGSGVELNTYPQEENFPFYPFSGQKEKAVLINSLVIHIVLLSKMMLDNTKPSLTV